MMEQFGLKDKVAVVTGGARGIGEVYCNAFAEAGAAVVVADRLGEEASIIAADINSGGGRAISTELDVRSTSSVRGMVEAAISAFGKIDVLMNNAGIAINAPAESMTDEQWDQVVDINLKGVFVCCREVGKHMIERGEGGSIINIGSMSGTISNRPQPQCAYNASKAAVIMLSKSLAGEWAQHNIRVNTISPGYIATDMTKVGLGRDDWAEIWMDNTPMKRPGQPTELGPLAVYLASDASSFMTGSNVVIDGGYTSW